MKTPRLSNPYTDGLKCLALTLTLCAGLGAGRTRAAIVNGGFETGDFTGWSIESTTPAPVIDNGTVHSGSHSAYLGSDPGAGSEPNGYARISQTLTGLPPGQILHFWVKRLTDDYGYDGQTAYIADTDDNVLHRIFGPSDENVDWTEFTYELYEYAGRDIKIVFEVHQDGYGDNTSMRVDDLTLTEASPAIILTFGPGAVIDQNAKTITLTVPLGTDLATLAPIFTLSSGTCDQTSGSPPSPTFAGLNPATATYTVTDGDIVNVYTVTVTSFGLAAPPGEMNVAGYDATQGITFLNPIANLLAVAPNGTGIQTADINYGTFAGMIPGITDNDTLAVVWDGWLDVTKSGHGDYTFGTASDDGSVVYVDLNNDGVFDPATELVVDNNNIQGTTIGTGTVTLNMNSVHVLIGFFENEGGQSMEARFAKGTGVGWGFMQNVIGAGPYFSTTDPYGSPQARILNFGPGAMIGTLAGNAAAITWSVPHGTNVTSLAPTFTLSPGATCNHVSGTAYDFTNPVAYTVTSSDSLITDTYTVTVHVLPPGPPVAGYTRWFDASALALADNALVTQWNDLSGNGANASVPNGHANPTFIANAGMESGLPAIHFTPGNGSSGALQFAEDSNIRTVFAIFKGSSFLLTDIATGSYDFHRWNGEDIDPTVPLWDGPDTNNWSNGNLWTGNGALNYVNGVAVDGTTFTMLTALHNGYNLVEVLTAGPVQADSWNADRNSVHTGNQSQAEVIIYDRVLSEQERLQVETYLTNKWFASPTDYDNWLKGFTFASGANTTATGDPDGDGMSNLQEYAFGLDPTSGKSCSPVTVPLNKSAGTFTYTRRATPATTGLTYTVWTSADLATWTVDAGAVEGTIATAGDVETVPVTISAGLLAAPKLFVRVMATDVPAPPGGM